MSHANERIARLRLIRSENVGPITFGQLLARFGTATAALEALPDLARRGGGRPPRIASRADAEREIATVERFGATHLHIGIAPYPTLLAQIEDAPPVITVKGHTVLFEKPTVAIIGARNASAAAVRFARGLAMDLGAQGLVVVSGLARGIDAAAHTGALDGGTIAVLAGGADVAYPPENAELQARISEQGLIVAEMSMGIEPQARHFPRRNRIISGLSLGVVVVEAAPKSGSLITARLAGEQGREVMAVPGSPLDPRTQGCNGLIREGATLVQSAEDIIASLPPFAPRNASTPIDNFTSSAQPVDVDDADRQTILTLLSPAPVPVDELVRQSNLSPAIVQTALLELELAGRLARHAGGRVALAE